MSRIVLTLWLAMWLRIILYPWCGNCTKKWEVRLVFLRHPKKQHSVEPGSKKHFNWSFRTNFSHLNAVQRVDAHVQEDTIQNLRMRSSKSHKLLFKYRHGNLGKDGRHEGWEANQDENHNMGHPGSAQVVVFSCYFWWTQINPNELTQKAGV